MKVRPYTTGTDEMIYPGMPEKEMLGDIKVWGDLLSPEYRLQMVTLDKIEDVVRIIRALLRDEMNRLRYEYVAQNIWRDGNRLNFAFTRADFEARPGDAVGREHYVEFASAKDAEFFEIIFHAILRLGMTSFVVRDGWNTLDGCAPPMPLVVNHLGQVA